jgi:archaellum biogenesis protein FlaJ (TadC family)
MEYTGSMIVALSGLSAMFITTFLRGFQNKNVAGGHKLLAFFCGGAMTLFEGVVIALIAQSGKELIFFTALGSAFGWVCGMLVHEWIMHKKIKAAKKAKKTKRQNKLEALIEERLEERLKELGVA